MLSLLLLLTFLLPKFFLLLTPCMESLSSVPAVADVLVVAGSPSVSGVRTSCCRSTHYCQSHCSRWPLFYFWPPCFWGRPCNFWHSTVAGIPVFDVAGCCCQHPTVTGALPGLHILSVAVVSVPAVVCVLLLLVSLLILASLRYLMPLHQLVNLTYKIKQQKHSVQYYIRLSEYQKTVI